MLTNWLNTALESAGSSCFLRFGFDFTLYLGTNTIGMIEKQPIEQMSSRLQHFTKHSTTRAERQRWNAAKGIVLRSAPSQPSSAELPVSTTASSRSV